MINFEKEVCKLLNIPSIPKKEWDGKSSFKNGVAEIKLAGDNLAYAVASFDAEKDKAPRVTTSFSTEPFFGINKVYVVPAYMETDVKNMDLDDKSKEAAEELRKEAEELENQDTGSHTELPENEYCFDHIHNDEEAVAFIEAYNKENKIPGAVPRKHESIIARLAVIYADLSKRAPKEGDDQEKVGGDAAVAPEEDDAPAPQEEAEAAAPSAE